jgi:Ferredoxin
MKVKVNQETCIGCGACQAIAPDVFEINDEGLAVEMINAVSDELVEDTKDAIEGCPVDAIYEPTDEEE